MTANTNNINTQAKNNNSFSNTEDTAISFKARVNQNRTKYEKLADLLTRKFGTLFFLVLHLIWFITWIIINAGLTPIPVFDPYPYGLLTMMVSLEAIFLSIIVLISENREQKVNDIREELNLQLNKIIEKKIDGLTHLIMKQNPVRGRPAKQVSEALQPVNIEELEITIKREVEED